MEKYFYYNYDQRMGGNYCEIYDENLELVRIVKGVMKIPELQRIAKKNDVATALLITEQLNEKFVLVLGHRKMTPEQIKNVDANILGPKYAAQNKYDKANTKVVTIKFNMKTDADILEYLEGKNRQGTIKAALRQAIEEEGK